SLAPSSPSIVAGPSSCGRCRASASPPGLLSAEDRTLAPQALVLLALDRTLVHEHIGAVLLGDDTAAIPGAEPFAMPGGTAIPTFPRRHGAASTPAFRFSATVVRRMRSPAGLAPTEPASHVPPEPLPADALDEARNQATEAIAARGRERGFVTSEDVLRPCPRRSSPPRRSRRSWDTWSS